MTKTPRGRDEWAVITGANRGLGRAVAEALGRSGFRVLVGARDQAGGDAVAAAIREEGGTAECLPLDITDEDALARLVARLSESGVPVAVLVNNAGIYPESPRSHGPDVDPDPLRVSPTVLIESFRINAVGAVRIIQVLAPFFRTGSRILNVSSQMASLSRMTGGSLGYRMSKTALNAATRVFAQVFADRGILVNSVSPGWVRTHMGGPSAPRSIEEGIDTLVWMATDPDFKESGFFWQDRKKIDW
jgi:NAD(P)-dependent dehydrogenase (short-subunit alcohol dehydrogenase family)